MNISRRQKRVASLIKEEASRFLIDNIQNSHSGLITVTRVEMAADLKTATIYLSIYGSEQEKIVFDILDIKKGQLRKSIASKVKLKYNPKLIFSRDPSTGYESQIDKLLNDIKKQKNEK